MIYDPTRQPRQVSLDGHQRRPDAFHALLHVVSVEHVTLLRGVVQDAPQNRITHSKPLTQVPRLAT